MARRRAANTAASLLNPAPTCLRSARLCSSNGSQLRLVSVCARPLRHSTSRHDGGRRTYATTRKPEAAEKKPYASVKKTEGQRIAVVGGGLTGLTTAYYLAKLLPATTEITLYEGSGRLGGWLRSETLRVAFGSDYTAKVLFERGPRTLPGLGGSFDDLVLTDLTLDLGLKYATIANPRPKRWIYYPDHLVQVPPSRLQDLLEPLFLEAALPFGMVGVKRLLEEVGFSTMTMPDRDVSIADWLHGLTGTRSGWDSMVSAMVHGIHGGDVDKLSAPSVFGSMWRNLYLPSPEKGMRWVYPWDRTLFEHMGRDPLQQNLRKVPWPAIMGILGGMENLPKSLAHALKSQSNVTIKLNEPVKKIAYNQGSQGVEITTSFARRAPKSYNKVIATTTGPALASMTGNQLPTLADIPAVSMMVVTLFYPYPMAKPTGLGYLIPRTVPPEQNPEHALGVFFDSDCGVGIPGEIGGAKLTVMMGGHYYGYGKDLRAPSEDEAIRQAKAVVQRHLQIPLDTEVFATARLAKECIPQMNVGHAERLARAHEDLAKGFGGKLAVAGGTYYRNGVLGALRSGHDAARKIARGDWQSTGLGRSLLPEMVQVSIEETMVPKA